VIRTLLYLLGAAITAGLIVTIYAFLIFSPEEVSELFNAMTPAYTASFALWFALVVATINLALEVERVLGHGNLWRLFTGRYRKPRIEQRIFLFMDLKGSTALTETLGNELFSELLQECYQDLTDVVLKYDASVHQYVGDEVVMSWPSGTNGDNVRASVMASFEYQDQLLAKKGSYEERFGVMPDFRAGIDVGPVTIIEVGDVKRQIVYHGDVLNTAARLLELCKKRGEDLVVSHPVGSQMQTDSGVRTSWHGEVSLRGKKVPVKAFALQPA
ncbi:MAG: adenylate/guanylate cyclase domain-containing protein, partial [Rhodothermales bacterium]|nr:adenylate/guanylate cyclase domain-containing protein [Rhodothermales bacterium]